MDPNQLLRRVVNWGSHVEARGQWTREECGVDVVVHQPLQLAEDFDPLLGILMGSFIVAGKSDTKLLREAATGITEEVAWERFIDAERVGGQLDDVVAELQSDSGSRRAVIYLGRSDDSIDLRPCIKSAQFFVRHEKLCPIVSVRSWDLAKEMWLDIVTWSIVSSAVAQSLGVPLSVMRFQVGSAHVYHSDLKYARRVIRDFKQLEILDVGSLEEWRSFIYSMIVDMRLQGVRSIEPRIAGVK